MQNEIGKLPNAEEEVSVVFVLACSYYSVMNGPECRRQSREQSLSTIVKLMLGCNTDSVQLYSTILDCNSISVNVMNMYFQTLQQCKLFWFIETCILIIVHCKY